MQVWVITGDKQETAINIAIACKLIRDPHSLLVCNASTREEAHARLRELQQQLKQTGAKEAPPPTKGALCAWPNLQTSPFAWLGTQVNAALSPGNCGGQAGLIAMLARKDFAVHSDLR